MQKPGQEIRNSLNVNQKQLKQIIALACSPSKGFNSDSMLDAFLAGVGDLNGINIEKIYLNDLKIDNYSFLNRIPDVKAEPELVELIEKLVNCDGLVIAAPTFNFAVPAALKNLLDRLSYKALDYKNINWLAQPTGKLRDLRTFFLVSCGTPWYILAFTWLFFPLIWLKLVFWYFGARNQGGIYGAGLNGQNLAKDNVKLMSLCQKLGKNFGQKLVKY